MGMASGLTFPLMLSPVRYIEVPVSDRTTTAGGGPKSGDRATLPEELEVFLDFSATGCGSGVDSLEVLRLLTELGWLLLRLVKDGGLRGTLGFAPEGSLISDFGRGWCIVGVERSSWDCTKPETGRFFLFSSLRSLTGGGETDSLAL